MNLITKFVKYISKHARDKRAKIFRDSFTLDEGTKILDLGSESGSNIHSILEGTQVQPKNVFIADIASEMVEAGSKKYGFTPIVINEAEGLPFDDNYFDIVYCSSVIEHVTVEKNEIWNIYSGSNFRSKAVKRQHEFAQDIRRVGKQYFIQTPYKYFPIESHSWLPFIAWLPRWLLIPILRITNTFWVKKTQPDWYLLNKTELLSFFDNGEILEEKFLGMTKSIMVVSSQ